MPADHLEYQPRRVCSPAQPARNEVVGFQVFFSSTYTPPASFTGRGDPQVTSQADRVVVIAQPVRPFFDAAVRNTLRFTCRPPLTRHVSVLLQQPIANWPALSCTLRHPPRSPPFWGFSEHHFFQITVVFGTGPGCTHLGQSGPSNSS
jgi:hypothetical protein